MSYNRSAGYKTGDYHIKHEVLVYQHLWLVGTKQGLIRPGDMLDEPGYNHEVSLWDRAVAKSYPIWSLKRLRDGAEFTIGDEIEVETDAMADGKIQKKVRVSRGKIVKFFIVQGRMRVMCKKKVEMLSDIKIKRTWYISSKLRPTFADAGITLPGPSFPSRESAQRHIIENSPCLSFSEVLAVTGRSVRGRYGRELEKLVKQKMKVIDTKHTRHKSNTLTPDRRKEIAKKASIARWSGAANRF